MNWRHSPLLHSLVNQPRLGLVTDMDGTISPIVDQPDQARVTDRSRQLLHELNSRLTLVAVVSGRAVDDVRQRVDLPDLVYVGNHGLETWDGQQVIPAPEAIHFRPHLDAALDSLRPHQISGMLIEDKGATLSIHYRNTADPAAAAAAFRPQIDRIARDQHLRVFQGRMVFELRPPVEIHKGTVFRRLVEQYHLQAALYIGDDTTDVDALEMAHKLYQEGICQAVGIGVESPDMPSEVAESADVMASGVSDVEALLGWLLQARSASSTCM